MVVLQTTADKLHDLMPKMDCLLIEEVDFLSILLHDCLSLSLLICFRSKRFVKKFMDLGANFVCLLNLQRTDRCPVFGTEIGTLSGHSITWKKWFNTY